MFQKSQDASYLNAVECRLQNDYLVWAEQFLDIIAESLDLTAPKTLNDVGCNLGHFYKGFKRRNLNLEYRGYDIEPMYLKKACEFFPEIKGRLFPLNITETAPEKSDVTVVSALLEHLETLSPGLDHLLESTNEMICFRTFLGENAQKAIYFKDGAQTYYHINQYSFLEVLDTINKHGFCSNVVRDRYTDSMPKYLGQGIVRTQYVVIAQRP